MYTLRKQALYDNDKNIMSIKIKQLTILRCNKQLKMGENDNKIV